MNILIPIGSVHQNDYQEDGYLAVKPLIRFLGKSMIFWIIDNLKLTPEDRIYLIYSHLLTRYNFKQNLLDYYRSQRHQGKINNYIQIEFLELFYQTKDVVETLYLGMKMIPDHTRKTLSIDSDTIHLYDVVNQFRNLSTGGVVYHFEVGLDQEEIYSYLQFAKGEDSRRIMAIKEKEKISRQASTGCYGFQSGTELYQYLKSQVDQRLNDQKQRLFLSSVIQKMIDDNLQQFIGYQLTEHEFVCLGNPHLLKINSQRADLHRLSGTKRFCFDLDHTLVRATSLQNGKLDYSQVEPIVANINFLKHLRQLGHYIIIYTARRMKTHQGNQGKILKEVAKITFETLEQFGIEYDEIHFGKPYADYYIDDLSINSYYNLEQELGFYQLFIPERSKNQIEIKEDSIIKKAKKKVLDGEIYYYQHLPEDLKELFPKLLDYGFNPEIDRQWYQMEKIEGVTLSHLYLNGNLSVKILDDLLKTIDLLHSYQNIDLQSEIPVYSNYLPKIKERYQNYAYNQFEGSDLVYQKLTQYFEQYQSEDRAKIGMIHGDPVFSNLLVTKLFRYKMIDIRGKLGDQLSIYGDIKYDYGKIYQSLIGYDSILLDTPVNAQYQSSLIQHFEKYLEQKDIPIEEIKCITASLLFTLIPIHHNHKCQKYFDLIKLVLD